VTLTAEARAAVANSNHADLFISLHVGYSANKEETGSSIYVIQNGFAASLAPEVTEDRLFQPWYLAYRNSRPRSEQLAALLQQELTRSLPDWRFPIRNGPIGVLASAAMPSIALEVGNLNNPANAQMLADEKFHTQLASIITAAVEQFSANRSAGEP
jgi:N-acetylmuramoyl-L-alanine amidase